MNILNRFVLAGCCLLAMGRALVADEPAVKAEKKPASSLNDEVRKGLGADPLIDDLLPKTDDKNPKPVDAAKKPAGHDELDKQLLEGLMDGEDLGAAEDPLMRLGKKMQQAGGLIGQTKSGEETQLLQKRIVDDLELLIKQARQQQQQQQNSSANKHEQSAQREMVKQSQPKQSQSKQPAQQPGQQSTERLGKNDVRRPEPGQVNDMIKSIWGQLPGRAKEEMLWNANDQFLPKYELLIEDYFKSLVERQQKRE